MRKRNLHRWAAGVKMLRYQPKLRVRLGRRWFVSSSPVMMTPWKGLIRDPVTLRGTRGRKLDTAKMAVIVDSSRAERPARMPRGQGRRRKPGRCRGGEASWPAKAIVSCRCYGVEGRADIDVGATSSVLLCPREASVVNSRIQGRSQLGKKGLVRCPKARMKRYDISWPVSAFAVG